jgi:hypothetical protein
MKKLIIGLDVSTSITGVCILDPESTTLVDGSHILFLDRVEFKGADTLWKKADRISDFFQSIKENYPDASWKMSLEEPLLGFQKGMSSAMTITTLMRFNGIVSYIGRKIFDTDPIYVSSAHARKLCGIKMQRTSIAGMSGKEQVFKYMSENDLKHVDWPKKKNGKDVEWSRDATDAYVIAKATLLTKDN